MTNKKRILVIDDEPDLVKAVALRLEANGYEVIQAFGGEEGLRKAKEENPDLIILDIMMPKMDGYMFILELRESLGDVLPPIIVLTVKEKMEDLFAVEGIKDYVIKPFEHQDILNRIKRLLEKKPE